MPLLTVFSCSTEQERDREEESSLSHPARVTFYILKVFVWMTMVCFGTSLSKARPDPQLSRRYLLADLRNHTPSLGSKADP